MLEAIVVLAWVTSLVGVLLSFLGELWRRFGLIFCWVAPIAIITPWVAVPPKAPGTAWGGMSFFLSWTTNGVVFN